MTSSVCLFDRCTFENVDHCLLFQKLMIERRCSSPLSGFYFLLASVIFPMYCVGVSTPMQDPANAEGVSSCHISKLIDLSIYPSKSPSKSSSAEHDREPADWRDA